MAKRYLFALSWQGIKAGSGDIELWLPLSQDLNLKLYNIRAKKGVILIQNTESSGSCPFFFSLLEHLFYFFGYLPLFWSRTVGQDLLAQIK